MLWIRGASQKKEGEEAHRAGFWHSRGIQLKKGGKKGRCKTILSAFRPSRPPSRRGMPSVRPGLRFQGSAFAALLAMGAVLGSAQHFASSEREVLGNKLAVETRALAAKAVSGGSEALSSERVSQQLSNLLRGREAWLGWVQARGSTEDPHPEFSKGEHVWQMRQPLNNLADDELVIRVLLAEPIWMSQVPSIAGLLALVVFFAARIFLGLSFRHHSTLLKALGRASREDFSARVPVSGCREMRENAEACNHALTSLAEAQVRVSKVYLETSLALARTVEAKDRYTSGHSRRVARYCVEMGEWIGFDPERLHVLEIGALLHDIGKVAVPDSVLLKPGKLDDDEFEQMRRHPIAGDRILSALPGLRDAADVARSHHERWDGKGFPYGASGDSIPLEGRICAIADAFDAMTTKRSYKSAMPVEKALEILLHDAGAHFDPEMAQLFVAMKRNGIGYKALTKPMPNAKIPERVHGQAVKNPVSSSG